MQGKKIREPGIYCIENKEAHKKYVGQSVDIKDRRRRHLSDLKHNAHCNDYLQKARNKYGEDGFDFYVLEHCDNGLLNEREDYYIQLYNTMDRDYGYNLKSGGQDHNYLSLEVRQKISKANKEAYQNNSFLKDQRKIDALNQWANPQIKEKIMGENNGMYGKHHSEETRKKMSEMKKGKLSPKRNMTPVLCKELNKVFECAAVASRETGVYSGCILSVCRGERKTASGYHWEFKLENNIG